MGQLYSIRAWMSAYWGETGLLLVFVGACIYFYTKVSTKNKKTIALITVLIWIMCYSGTAVKISRIVGYYDEWYRMFWILPVIPVVASFFVSIVSEQKEAITKAGMIIMLIMVIASTSVDGLSNITYRKIQNDYGLNGEYIAVANVINADGRADEPHIACGQQEGIELRLWDPSMFYSITRVAHYCITNYGVDFDLDIYNLGQYNEQMTLAKVVIYGREEDPEELLNAIETEQVDYLVIKNDKLNLEYFEEMGIEYCGSTVAYNIFYCGMHK